MSELKKITIGKMLNEKALRKYLYGKIATFKIPRYVVSMNEFPMTPSGKIQKYKLREMLTEQLVLQSEMQ